MARRLALRNRVRLYVSGFALCNRLNDTVCITQSRVWCAAAQSQEILMRTPQISISTYPSLEVAPEEPEAGVESTAYPILECV